MSEEEIDALSKTFFALGMIYNIKLEKKYGRKIYTEKEIKEMEVKLLQRVSQLSPAAQELFSAMNVNSDLGLITGIYKWSTEEK